MMRGPIDRLDDQPDETVIEEQDGAGCDVAREFLVVEADLRRIADLRFGIEDEALPGLQLTLPPANLPTRIFGPCRSAMMAISRPSLCAASRTLPRTLDMIGALAV